MDIETLLSNPIIEGGGRGVVAYLKLADEVVEHLEKAHQGVALLDWLSEGHDLCGRGNKKARKKRAVSLVLRLTSSTYAPNGL